MQTGLVSSEPPGSSPRMRGALFGLLRVGVDAGIIPAYAGSACRGRRTRPVSRDHPRVCGEHQRGEARLAAGQGSSPRMRGAPYILLRSWWADGIIPAYAGSTLYRSSLLVGGWDHPRVCGEHERSAKPKVLISGSSPRMRGAPASTSPGPFATGIIPAYAGSTAARGQRGRARGDHPRVCGEHMP